MAKSDCRLSLVHIRIYEYIDFVAYSLFNWNTGVYVGITTKNISASEDNINTIFSKRWLIFMLSGIYMIKNIVNGKAYVGQSIDIEARKMEHIGRLNSSKHRNSHLQSAWNKYGEQSFIFSIVEECSEEELNKREEFWIDKLGTLHKSIGYNKRPGGNSSRLTEEAKAKLSASRKGIVFSEEHKRNLSLSRRKLMRKLYGNKGRRNPMYGKKHSEESKEKMSLAASGRIVVSEVRQKLSEAKKGKALSEEAKAKISSTLKNRKAISEEKALQIIDRIHDGSKSLRKIADEFGVSLDVVFKIKSNKTWKHLKRPWL